MNYQKMPEPQKPRKSTGSPKLTSLVEQYLAENSNLSYINIDDMIDTLQASTFRFARMKRNVFGNLIRNAYENYCQRNLQFPTQGPSEVVEDGSPPEDDSDSDVEIQEEYQPKSDLVNSKLTSLYSPAAKGQKSVPTASTSVSQSEKNVGNGTPGRVVQPVEPPRNSTLLVADKAILGIIDTVGSTAPGDDSDNDLEIIDEVKGDGLIRQSNENGMMGSSVENPIYANLPINGILLGQNDLNGALPSMASLPRPAKIDNTDLNRIQFLSTNNNITITEIQSKDGRNWRPERPPPPHAKKVKEIESQAPTRGIKRKTAVEQNAGINENLTPKKLKKEISVVQDSGYRLSDFAGSEKVVEEVCRLLMHLKHPEVYKTLGVTAPRGFLLHGPPGTGKTLLANALAGELQLPMLKVTGTEFISGISGESESNIRDLFNQAVAIAPCIIFIDEIDSITPKRENAQREMERRVVAQLLSCVDDLMNHENGSQVLLIGATNRIEAIDSALRRAGRFDREICLGIPDEKSRAKILAVICRNLRLAPGFDLNLLAKYTPGYVGADLSALVREAAVQAVNKALVGSDKIRNSPDVEHILTSDKENLNNGHIMEITITETEDQGSRTQDTLNKQDQPSVITLEEVTADSTDTSKDPVVDGNESGKELATGSIETIETSKELTVAGDGTSKEPESEKIPENGEPMEVDSTENANIVVESTEQTISSEVPVKSNLVAPSVSSSFKKPETQSHSAVEKEEEPLHLRWIRETAPLSKNELDELYIFMDDFEIALKYVQPSSKREGFATVPDTTWDDIGALKNIREELEVSILGPVKHSSAFQMLGLNTPAGVLLCGPPGCGKTLLAKAVANEAGINFISVKGPELLNMYVGESERAVRQCFLRAKNSSPCVIFFDELDALCPRRSDNPESGSGSRIVNQLLTEMDGMESRAGVFVMAATNRPDIIDPAILRPGRLDKILFVDLPAAEDRFEILKAITKEGTKPILDIDVNLKDISEREACDNYTGADLAALVREASIAAFRDLVLKQDGTVSCPDKDLKVSARHFDTAFLKTKPSVTKKDRQKYAEMKERYSSLRER